MFSFYFYNEQIPCCGVFLYGSSQLPDGVVLFNYIDEHIW